MPTSIRPEILTDCGSVLRPGLNYANGVAAVTVSVPVRGNGSSAVEWVPIVVTSERHVALKSGG